MKNYINFILSILFIGFIFFGYNAYAKDAPSNIMHLNGQTVSETRFNDRTTKKEVISCYKYDYSDTIPDSSYEYVTVRVDITYLDSKGKNIANAYFESNFRYNKKIKLAKCLSTSHGEHSNSPKYSISIFARTKNLAVDIGESFGKVVLFKNSQEKDVSKYIFSCDNDGNLSRHVL